MPNDYFAGIDVGSLSTEAVIVDSNKHLLSYSIVNTGINSSAAAEEALSEALQKAELPRNRIAKIIATGYGRAAVGAAHKRMTEITCHAAGAQQLFPEVRTVIDIGGQDSKVIHIGQDGQLVDFAMNDKCAAGTGRFLEIMAKRLEVKLEKLGDLALLAEKAVSISNTCTVFAESEVVSLVAQNHPIDEIIRGLHVAIVNRIWNQVQTVGVHGQVALTGGVALNRGVVNLLEEKLEQTLEIYSEPQIVGALGAAILASK
ncbi:MAG: 2-hydroxyglutaryl-CoA dehydratase [Candidatus Marinimicrobia bacterium]|nr:2-hydroxyglutaryl-CoA dehydratase [Candidatus Neomarinimicrobiota bacterium]